MSEMLAQVGGLWRDLTGHELFFWGDGALLSASNTAPAGLLAALNDTLQHHPAPVETILWQNQTWLIGRLGPSPTQISIASLLTDPAAEAQFERMTGLLDGLAESQQAAQQLGTQLSASSGHLNFLYNLAQFSFQTDDPAQLYPRLAQSLSQVSEAEDICLAFWEADQPHIYTASGRNPSGLEKLAVYASTAAPLSVLSSADSVPRALLRAIPNLKNLLILPLPLTGELRGLVALVNHSTGSLNQADQQLLTNAGELISMLITSQFARHNRDADRRLELELSFASQIQAIFLPTTLPDIPELEFGASLMPAHLISGDFYDVQGMQDGWAIMVGDVAGKGIPAAMLAAMIHATLKSEVHHHTEPAELLQSINHLIYAELDRSETFITSFLAVLQTRPLQLHYASAGHTTTLLWRSAEQHVLQLPSTGLPLGIYPESVYAEHHLPLKPGDVLVLYSDGITEAENDQGRVFGGQALIDLLLAGHPAPIDKQLQLIFNALDLHRGKLPLRDDVVLLMVRARGTETATLVQPFVFMAEKRSVRTLATQVRQVASSLTFSGPAERSAFLNDLELAVSEITANIVIHAYHDSPYLGRIQGRVTLFPEKVQVDLIDSGIQFNSPTGLSLLQAEPAFSPSDPPTGGYGLSIARRLLDTCAYTRLPEGRNHWHLEKFISQVTSLPRPDPATGLFH
ncbi:MAG TPA: SpoIIE family protein phosphatase [Anaerolineales bacterium]|nr:SpoIIE family protein phosphatase [Anaerolineales bacterium]